MIYECNTCGNIVNKYPSQAKRSKSGKHFCSRSCAVKYTNTLKSGSKHPNWKSGHTVYRTKALKTKEHKCEKCNYNNIVEILQVHHKDGDRKNNNIDNLMILCPNCHAIEHFQTKTGPWLNC